MSFPRTTLLALVALIVCAVLAGPARAVTYNVNNTGDQPDASPGNQICASDTQGCTLRAAIDEAGSDDIFLDNTINVPAGTYDVSSPLTPSFTTRIVGAGARTTVIRRSPEAGSVRVFQINFATVDIRGVTIRDGIANSANGFFGGNIFAQDSTVTLSDSLVTGGSGSSGGGFANNRGTFTLQRSTVAANKADTGGGDGGAIQNGNTNGDQSGSTLIVENSTISGNSALLAGGIISGGHPDNAVTVRNSTIASNDSGSRGGGGGILVGTGSATFTNSIVALNGSGAADPPTPNCSVNQGATLTSSGHNIESGTECGFTSPGDKQGVDPLLGPLQNAGGQTDTRPLLAGSPAIDAGGASGCPATDQRGVTRPQGLGCDIGAFEVLVVPDTVIVAGPSVVTQDRTPTFTFSSTEPGTTFECSVDNSPFVACTSPFSVPELRAGRHTFAVRARDAAGNVDPSPASFTFVIPAKLSDLPAPVLGRTVNAEPVSGTVLVAVPGGAGSSRRGGARASQKGLKFVPLQEARQIPVGSFFNTSKGRVRLQSATSRRGKRQAGVFSGGLFQTLQSGKKSAGAVFELRLKGSSFKSCAAKKKASVSRRSKRRVRRLSGNAKGRFRTRGRYSAATVRGTIWTVTDRCDGTLTQVRSGQVTVRDLRRHKNIRLRRGKSYLARAPG